MNELPPLTARFGDFQIDEGNARLSRDGRPVELTPKAFDLLCVLLRQPGQLVLKDTLLDAVWGHRHVSDSVLKTTISQLRGALADDAKQPRYIETAARRGYRFIAVLGGPGAPPGPGAVAEPPPPAAPAGPGLIARAAPLALLHEACAAAQRGQRQLLLLAGEAGIGKSTLIDRFVAELPAGQVLHAHGQCVELYGSAEPYMPVLEALNMLCRGEAADVLLELMRRVAPTWLVQLPWFLGDADRLALQREVTGATQDRMLREFGELLDRYTAQQPLLLVLEDLHWSDHATVQLIGFLARRRTPAALLLLASFRPAEVIAEEHPLAGLRQELRLHRLCREIDLETFSEAEVGELLGQRLDGEDAPEDFVRALHAHTEGLPLYVVNLLDELLAEGGLRRDGDGRWAFPEAAHFGVPHHVVGVVEKQITRLPPEQQRLLGAASVAGVEFLHLPLAALLQVPPEALQEALDTAVARRHWLRSTGVVTLADGRLAARYAFRHALYRHVFYQRLGLAQRMQWHRRIGAALLDVHGASAREIAAELALHFERGGDGLAAARQLAVVAGRALARSAAREAVQAARQGLRLLEALQEAAPAALELELRVLEGVALTRLHVFSDPAVAAAFERAQALCEHAGDDATQARALHGLWWVRYARCELGPALALAQRILALGGQGGSAARLQLAGHSTMGITLAMLGRMRESREHLETALALCAGPGDELPPGLFVQHPGVETRSYLALVSWWLGLPQRSRQLAAEAVALARTIRHPISRLIAQHLNAVVHYFAGEDEAALASVGVVFEVIQREGLPTRPGAFTWFQGHLLARRGEVERGMALMREAEQSCLELQMRVGLTGFCLHYAEACHETGRREEAQAMLARGLAMIESGSERFMLSPMHRLQALLLRERGEPDAAAQSLRRAIEAARAQGAAFHELRALVEACDWAPAADAAARERLGELLAAYRDEDIALVRRGRALLAG